MTTLAFKGGAFDPPQITHLAIAEQVHREKRADKIHIGPSGTRPDKSYNVTNVHRRRMLEIMLEERPDLRDIVVADFDFIDAPREKSATHGVDAWFRAKYGAAPHQIFGTDVIPNIDKFWMESEWVKKEAFKIFIPRGTEEIDFGDMQNYQVMPFLGTDFQKNLSSSQIRKRIPEGDFRGLSLGVAEYIQQQGLYLPEANSATISLYVADRIDQIMQGKKSRTETGEKYPERFPIPECYVSWGADFPEYQPVEFTAPEVFEEFTHHDIRGWADAPEKYAGETAIFRSYTGAIIHGDEHGRPLNPMGRTGISGRGLLGKWGANFAADPLVTRYNPTTGAFELLVVQRQNGEWALPGGMVDFGEYGSDAAKRELWEEARVDVDFSRAPIVYQGYVDDPRNTDHAWMETTAVHVHLSPEQAIAVEPEAGSDAKDVRWMPLVDHEIDALYANHGQMVRSMMSQYSSRK